MCLSPSQGHHPSRRVRSWFFHHSSVTSLHLLVKLTDKCQTFHLQKCAELDASSILMNIAKCTVKSKKTSVSTIQLGFLFVSLFFQSKVYGFMVTVFATLPGRVNRTLCIQGLNASWKPLNFESKLLRPWKVLENLFYSFLVFESPWIFIDPHFQSLKTSVKVRSPSSHVIQTWRAVGSRMVTSAFRHVHEISNVVLESSWLFALK